MINFRKIKKNFEKNEKFSKNHEKFEKILKKTISRVRAQKNF